MTDAWAFNSYLFQGGRQPEGARPIEPTRPFVKSTRRHKAQKLHRPAFLASATIDGRNVLGARFLCGRGYADVAAVADTSEQEQCPHCEHINSPDSTWAVYCYRDAQGAPLYIGQTFWLERRDRIHATAKKSAAWWPRQVELEVLSRHATSEAAVEAEREAILALAPEFNIQHNKRSAA